MKTKIKIVRFVAAAALGSLLWAGCASPRDGYSSRTLDSRPVDLTDFRADTYPHQRTALFDTQNHVVDVYNPVITEAAGARFDTDVYVEPDPGVTIESDPDIDVEINRRP